jgi:type IV secretory pathway TraG/TraD family ATPase VirD4
MFVLGRDRWTRYKPLVLWFFDQSIEKELSRTLHDRINSAQKLLIAAEFVMIPKMRA